MSGETNNFKVTARLILNGNCDCDRNCDLFLRNGVLPWIQTASTWLGRYLNPCRDESRPFLATKRDVLLTVVRSRHKVPSDVVYVTRILHEKERSHLTHETRIYMMVAPADFSKFIVV